MSKAALVTGGAKRIGKSIALKLAELGYNIALHYNHFTEEATKACKEIESNKVKCRLYKCDLSNEKEVSGLIKSVYKDFSDLELLINNASIFPRANIIDTENELFDKVFNINLKAPFILLRDFAKLASKGLIINMLDTKISVNDNIYSAYWLTKKGLADLTLIAAKEFGPGIRVNGICPGLILPPKDKDQAYLDSLAKKLPLQKKGSPEDITNAVEFFVKNEYVTGQFLFMDGGQHLI